MELFCLKPAVHYFDNFSQFARDFSLSDKDLILTESIIYKSYIECEKVPCTIIFKDSYDPGEPKEEVIDKILEDIENIQISRIIAIGGGSVIDIAKLLCVENPRPIKDVIEKKRPIVKDKELIVLPTTCGTGSEVTFGGIVTMKDTGLKTGIMDPILSSNYAVLIPDLLKSLPKKILMHCSVDALGHSMEAYVSATRSNDIVRAVGGRAVEMILDGYTQIASCGDEIIPELMKQFIVASCMGGMAVNNGGAGPVHALAYPLGEKYHMSHGESIYQFLTKVFMHYERSGGGKVLDELGMHIKPALEKAGIKYDSVYDGLESLFNMVYPSRRLHEAGMSETDIEPFTDSIFASKQRLLSASYRLFTKDDAIRIYRERL